MKLIIEEPMPAVDFWVLANGAGFKLVETEVPYIKVGPNKAFNLHDNKLEEFAHNDTPCLEYTVEVRFY